ncbi:MAG TPA: twin-arginine translocation pathway signal protein [Hellea balneolensis]|uniref:Twin-arginine translocation pathway signal protein n=1 Tax=Hellea balneolensis TaxID=287478 RepID=A0A7C5R1W0_9PROT|nr:twin-arginine translocation pathway signal protein [Hellea balneolensis]
MKYWIKLAIVTVAVMFGVIGTTQSASAKADEIYTSWRSNMAVGGYDVVSFHQGNPIKGEHKISTMWKGAQWRFANQNNLETFLKDPEKYAPAYGGYCAWAIAQGKLAKGSPKYWSLRDGRLYLNFNKKIKQRWLEDTKGFIEKADKLWPSVLD